MSTAAELLERCAAAGIQLEAQPDGVLWVDPQTAEAEMMAEQLRDEIRQHKTELLACLNATAPAPITVICYTPAGEAVAVEARDEAHAEWLRRVNPPPKSVAPALESISDYLAATGNGPEFSAELLAWCESERSRDYYAAQAASYFITQVELLSIPADHKMIYLSAIRREPAYASRWLRKARGEG